MTVSGLGLAWRRTLLLLGAVLAAGACQFEERPPSGSGAEEEAAHATVIGFYAALAARDSAALRRYSFASGNALLDVTGSDVTLVPTRALLSVPERRTTGSAPRIVRVEMRLDGGIGSARVVLATLAADGSGEWEATDQLTLGRREGTWRIAHSQLGTWRIRTAP